MPILFWKVTKVMVWLNREALFPICILYSWLIHYIPSSYCWPLAKHRPMFPNFSNFNMCGHTGWGTLGIEVHLFYICWGWKTNVDLLQDICHQLTLQVFQKCSHHHCNWVHPHCFWLFSSFLSFYLSHHYGLLNGAGSLSKIFAHLCLELEFWIVVHNCLIINNAYLLPCHIIG